MIWDVIIVGAGPAGATLGYELANNGAKILVLEKDILPRYKPCGGGITYRTAQSIGYDLQPVIMDTITAASLSFRMRDEVTRHSHLPLAYMTNRADLDHYLIKRAMAAGCIVRDGIKVSHLERRGRSITSVCGSERFESRFLAGADGANSIVRRCMDLSHNLRWDVCIEDEIEVSPEDIEKWRGRVLLDLGSIPYGYGWLFPKRDHLSMGVAGGQWHGNAVHHYHIQFSKYLYKSLKKVKLMRRTGHRLPIRCKGAPLVGERVLLIGDAAGLTEPLSGEGIYYAVRSAQLAAKVVHNALSNPSLGLDRYEKNIDEELMPAIQRAKAYVRIFNRAPRFFYLLLGRTEKLWNATIRLLRGETDYIKIGKVTGPFEPLLDWLAW